MNKKLTFGVAGAQILHVGPQGLPCGELLLSSEKLSFQPVLYDF